jgi:peptidyl-prolyl cis-trans isomerase D
MFRYLKKKREAVKKYLLIFFLGIVSVGMVITLAPIPTGDTTRLDADALAMVNDTKITTTDLQREVTARLRGSPFGNDPRIIPSVAPGVLDEMVLQRAYWSEAKRLGLEVSNQELIQALQAIPGLYVNGTFIGVDRYQDIIQQQTSMSVPQFEAQIRESILQQKIRGVVTDGLQVSSAEVREGFLQRNRKAKIEYVILDPSRLLQEVETPLPALQAFFNQGPDRYKLPERRRVRYVLIGVDDVRSRVKLDDSELRQYYAQHLADYRVPDRVKVAHILLKTTGKTPAEIAAIEKKAQDLLAQIKAGADFAELAKKNSEDSTAANGGDLGWVVRGQTVKEFEDTAFTLKPGQVSELVRTTYGIHLLKVFDQETAHLQTFDSVKDTIRAALEKQKLSDAQESLARELESKLKADPTQFDAVARKYGLEPKQTEPFLYNQVIPDFGNSETFANLAFQLRTGEIGMPITVPKGLAVIQASEIIPEHPPTFEEVRAQVEQDYRAAQSKVLAFTQAQEFATKGKSGDFRKLAQAAKLTVKESKDFTAQDSVEDVGSASQIASAFTMAPGQTSDAISAGGNHVVFRVVSITPANEADLPSQAEQIAEQLLEQKRTTAFEVFRQNLKQQLLRSGELQLNETALKNFLASYKNQ